MVIALAGDPDQFTVIRVRRGGQSSVFYADLSVPGRVEDIFIDTGLVLVQTADGGDGEAECLDEKQQPNHFAPESAEVRCLPQGSNAICNISSAIHETVRADALSALR